MTVSWNIASLLCMCLLVPCCRSGDEHPTETATERSWKASETEVLKRLGSVQGKQESLELEFASLPVADPSDTVVRGARLRLRALLDAQAGALSSLQTKINTLADQRSAVAQQNDPGAMRLAWRDAQPVYRELESGLVGIDSLYADIASELDRVTRAAGDSSLQNP